MDHISHLLSIHFKIFIAQTFTIDYILAFSCYCFLTYPMYNKSPYKSKDKQSYPSKFLYCLVIHDLPRENIFSWNSDHP